MALDKSVLVDMPEHGTVLRKVSGKTYVYYATAVYRNEKGQPTADRTSIGRYDEESGKLIPNRNYYEVYLKTDAPNNKAYYSCGVEIATKAISEKTGLKRYLKMYFPENYREILTAAQYMLCCGNVMQYIDDYTQETKTAVNKVMTNQQCSRLFESIREEDILLFLKDWLKRKKDREFIAYDVTSISSYAKNIPETEWGYNRDKEKLPQINMGMYYGEESGLPLYYRIYPGSISDKAHLKYMISDNDFIKAKNMSFVMDRGFYSADNLKYLTDKGCRFVMALPGGLKYCSDLIEKYRNEIVNHSQYLLGKGLPYAKSIEFTEFDFRMNIHIYYDPEKALQESEALTELIERQENDLKSMEEPPDRKLRYDKYFYINRTKDGKLAFKKNYKAIDEQLNKCGFFLIAETDFKHTSKEILEIYRTRNRIESSFDNLKNELDMKRLHTQTSQTMTGKIFCSFIALIFRSYMSKHLSESSETASLTFKKVIIELSKLKCFDFNPKIKPQLINPPTKLQRTILLSLDCMC